MPKTLKSAATTCRQRLHTNRNMAQARAAGHDHVKKAAQDSLVLYQRQIDAMFRDLDQIAISINIVENQKTRISTASVDVLHQAATAIDGALSGNNEARRLRMMVDVYRTGGDASRKKIEDSLGAILESLLKQREKLVQKINQMNASYQEIKMRLR